MRKVQSYEQTQGFVRQIRELRQGFVTNFYWDENKHPYWIAQGSLLFEQSDSCVLMLHRSEEFSNLYYIATSFAAFGELMNNLQLDGTLVADVVCKGEGAAELEAFAFWDFKKYQHLYRMSHVGQIVGSDWIQDARVKHAQETDVPLVYNCLQRDFDPLAAQIPSKKELGDYVGRKQLLVMKDGDKLCGFLIFEITGVTWYLRYWYTSPDYRNKGVGACLLKTSLLYGAKTKRQILWVIADNENAIKRYEHYGFKKENMNDYVMVKR